MLSPLPGDWAARAAAAVGRAAGNLLDRFIYWALFR